MYRTTWHTLHEMVEDWPQGKSKGGIIAFPIHVTEEFMSCVKDRDWTARILFLHYGVAMHLLSNKWYVGVWGRRMVTTVIPLEEEIPEVWRETVFWAREAVSFDVGYDGEQRREKSEMGL